MAIATPYNLGLMRAFRVYVCALGLPTSTKDIFCEGACTPDVGQVAFVEDVHNFIRNCEGPILQGRIAWQCVNELTQRGEVPEEAPSWYHKWSVRRGFIA